MTMCSVTAPGARMTEKEKQIRAMQSPAMQKLMALHDEGKKGHDEPWPPKDWLAVADAKTMDEAIASRPLLYEEAKVYATLRQHRGHYLATMRKEDNAESKNSHKEKAVEAFMMKFSLGVIKAKFKDLMVSFESPLEKAKAYIRSVKTKDEN